MVTASLLVTVILKTIVAVYENMARAAYKVSLIMEKQCVGACFRTNDCKGKVKTVEVFTNYFDDTNEYDGSWGIFDYCEHAIEVDRKNGFYVKILE